MIIGRRVIYYGRRREYYYEIQDEEIYGLVVNTYDGVPYWFTVGRRHKHDLLFNWDMDRRVFHATLDELVTRFGIDEQDWQYD